MCAVVIVERVVYGCAVVASSRERRVLCVCRGRLYIS